MSFSATALLCFGGIGLVRLLSCCAVLRVLVSGVWCASVSFSVVFVLVCCCCLPLYILACWALLCCVRVTYNVCVFILTFACLFVGSY